MELLSYRYKITLSRKFIQHMLHQQPSVIRIGGFIKRDRTDPNQKKALGPYLKLATVEERIPIKHHPHYAALQRAVDGWAWYTSNVGQLLPNFNDIEPEEVEEPLPQVGGATYHTWHEVTGELWNPAAQQRIEERELPPLVQVMPEPDLELPHAQHSTHSPEEREHFPSLGGG